MRGGGGGAHTRALMGSSAFTQARTQMLTHACYRRQYERVSAGTAAHSVVGFCSFALLDQRLGCRSFPRRKACTCSSSTRSRYAASACSGIRPYGPRGRLGCAARHRCTVGMACRCRTFTALRLLAAGDLRLTWVRRQATRNHRHRFGRAHPPPRRFRHHVLLGQELRLRKRHPVLERPPTRERAARQ